MKTLYLAWKESTPAHAWYPVGMLEADTDNNFYRFRYTQGAAEAREKSGFAPFDSFPELTRVYESAELFPLFANRVQNPERPSFKDYLLSLDMATGHQPDPIELLAVSEGRRATDSLEVFPKVERNPDGVFDLKFFLHGWRHIHPAAIERMAKLQPGEKLNVSLDCTNPVTSFAIQILTADYIMLGWVPRYLFSDFADIIFRGGCPVEARVVRYNPPPASPAHRLLIDYKGCFPQDHEPMSDGQFRPLILSEAEQVRAAANSNELAAAI